MSSMQRFKVLARLALTTALFTLAAGPGCGNGPPKEPEPQLARTPASIKIFAGPEGKRIDFAPSFHGAAAAKPSGTLQPKVVLTEPDVDPTPVTKDAQEILLQAARECGQFHVLDPGTEGAWFVFPTPPQHCEEVLRYEETMLCMAQKLEDIASAVAPITWRKDHTQGPWVIPAQASSDRFIVRDWALVTLAHLALTDMYRFGLDVGDAQCSEALSAAASGVVYYAWEGQTVVPSVEFNDLSVIFTNAPTNQYITADYELLNFRETIVGDSHRLLHAPTLAKRFLNYETHILRAASRLAEKVIRAEITDDLAGAEAARTKGIDPLTGNRLAWGTEATLGTATYDSLTHAARVLFGRLDAGPARPTYSTMTGYTYPTACSLFPATGNEVQWPLILRETYGADLSARTNSVPPVNGNQRTAVQMVTSAGIAIPGAALEADFAAVRAAVAKQLRADAAIRVGVSPTDPNWPTDPRAKALDVSFAEIGDGDLRYALQRAFDQFRLMTHSAESVASITLAPGGATAGLKPASYVAPELVAVGGIAVAGGISKRDLVYDFTARAAGLQWAGQCAQATPDFSGMYAYSLPFQSAFSMAQMLYSRVVLLREWAAAYPEVTTLADEAKAEMRAFAGPGFVDAWPTGGTYTDFETMPPQITLVTHGVERPGLLTAPVEEREQSLVLVRGPSWVADCAASLRTKCPDNLAPNIIVASSLNAHTAKKPIDGASYERTFSLTSLPTGAMLPSEYLYVVQPKWKGKPGKVLGVVSTKVSGLDTYLTVSDVQTELLNKVLGFDERSGSCGSRFEEEADPSKSPAYCIKDVPRNLYVPLSNEVTSDIAGVENSWKYYLKLAREAAARADGLGQKLIDIGIQQDLRREAANEEFAKVCGSFSALETMKFKDGKIDTSSVDESVKACVDDRTIKLVAFGPKPKNVSAAESELLGCSGTPPLHPKCGALDETDLEGLDIVKRDQEEGSASCAPSGFMSKDCSVRCGSALSAVESLASSKGFDATAVSSAVTASWAKRDTLHSIAGTLALKVDKDMEWTLTALGAPMMASASVSTTLFPGCLRGGSSTCGNSHVAHVFNHVLRGEKRADTESMSAVSADEAKVLLWRLEGLLWTLGVMSGGVPEGMFDVQVPAADFGSVTLSAGEPVPIPTVYGQGQWALEGGVKKLSASSNAEIRAKVGAAEDITTSYRWPAHAEIPSWIRGFYPSGALPGSGLLPGFVHVRARTSAFGPTDLNDPTKPVTVITGDRLAAYVSDTAAQLAGIRCLDGSTPRFTGNPVAGAAGSAAAVTTIGRWKTDSWPGAKNLLFWKSEELSVKDAGFIRVGFGSDTIDTKIEPLSTVKIGGAYFNNPVYYNTVNRFNVEQLHATSLGQTSLWSPADVARVWINSYPPNGTCGAAAELAQTLALACNLSDESLFPSLDSPPKITDLNQLGAMQRWLARQSSKVRQLVGKLYIEDVPRSVVNEFKTGKPGAASIGGDRAVLTAKIAGSLSQVGRIADSIAGDLALLSIAFADVQTQVALAKIDTKSALGELTVRRLSIYGAMAAQLAQAAEVSLMGTMMGTKDAVEAVNAVAQIAILDKQLDALKGLESTYLAKEGLVVEAAFNTLQTTVTRHFTSIKENIGSIRTQGAETRALLEELRGASTKATYQAAKAAGQPFALGADGKPIASYPVNAALNRQYAVTEIRYQRALDDAKYLAYLARLAIEQRFGVRLESLATRVGSLDPPATWVNSVCSLSGIDYKAIRDTTPAVDGGVDSEKKLLGEFADQYIGDYVGKLERFVEFYNIDHPSHEADDMVVLSLKNDLLGGPVSCVKTAPNLLYYSANLAASDVVAGPIDPIVRGWTRPFCGGDATRCVEVLPATALSDGSTILSPASGEIGRGISWVRESTRTATSSDAGVAVEAGAATSSGAPPVSVSQVVQLEPGTYLLTWWDQARTASGAPVTSAGEAVAYRLGVYSAGGSPAASYTGVPYFEVGDAGASGGAWSSRRKVVVTIPTSGAYHVSLTPSVSDALGSVLISGLQLEWTEKPSGEPTRYIATSSSREYVSAECGERSVAELQKAFKRDCDSTGACYYELTAPFYVDTVSLNSLESRIRGKLAAGNFNYRHIDVFLNLVGTGVRDCSKSPTADCYGSGYTEYSLFHDAFQTSVLGWDGGYECFNFGSAAIRRGKALAAERYITVPVGAADLGLLTQPAIEKHEFRGRPLDGSYKLRIWDSPALAWNRLTDVQLILKYRYWSRVDGKAK